MKISEIMVLDPITIADTDVLSEATRRMDEHAIRHLPVLRSGALVGVLSDRDLLEPQSKLVPRLEDEADLEPPIVRDVMGAQPVTVTPETSLAEAAKTMAKWGIGCLPVTRGKELLGLATEVDLLDALVSASRYGRLTDAKNPPLGECMTANPVTLRPSTTLARATRRMHEGDFRHLPVTDEDGRLVGLVSDRDLRRAAGRGVGSRTHVDKLALQPTTIATADESIARAAQRMSHERISALPIVDGSDRLVGILTVTDVLGHCGRVLD